MKKINMFLMLITLLFLSIIKVDAATITKVAYENGKISISGTGTSQVQAVIFDNTKKPVYLFTIDPTDGKFSKTLPQISSITAGTYTIKVADYDGSSVSSKTLQVKDESNPQTYDGIISSIIISIISIIGIVVGLIIFNKKNKSILSR